MCVCVCVCVCVCRSTPCRDDRHMVTMYALVQVPVSLAAIALYISPAMWAGHTESSTGPGTRVPVYSII